MKTNAPNQSAAKPEGGKRIPPVVHPPDVAEYDAQELAQRASQVTTVLEQILEEHPMNPPTGFQQPPPHPVPPA